MKYFLQVKTDFIKRKHVLSNLLKFWVQFQLKLEIGFSSSKTECLKFCNS